MLYTTYHCTVLDVSYRYLVSSRASENKSIATIAIENLEVLPPLLPGVDDFYFFLGDHVNTPAV